MNDETKAPAPQAGEGVESPRMQGVDCPDCEDGTPHSHRAGASYVAWRTAEGVWVVNESEAKRLSDYVRSTLSELQKVMRERDEWERTLMMAGCDRLPDGWRNTRAEAAEASLATYKKALEKGASECLCGAAFLDEARALLAKSSA